MVPSPHIVSGIDDLSVEKRAFFLPHLCSTLNLKMFSLHCIADILRSKSHDTKLITHVISFFSVAQYMRYRQRTTNDISYRPTKDSAFTSAKKYEASRHKHTICDGQ